MDKALEINPKTEFITTWALPIQNLEKLTCYFCVAKGIDDASRNGNFHYAIGLAYKDKGDLDNAEAALKKTLEVDPDFTDAHKVLEEIYRSKGMFGDADREAELYKSKSSPHH